MFPQQRDVVRSFPQRGDPDGDHVQPVVQVLSEPVLPSQGFQVGRGGSEEPDINPDRLVSRQPLEASLLDDAEELPLKTGPKRAHLVQIDATAVGLLEPPKPALDSPGDRPFLVAEKLPLQEIFGAIAPPQGTDRPQSPRAHPMNRRRQEVLSIPALPADKAIRV